MDNNNQDNVQTVQIAGFIAKTFQILNNQTYSKVIFWGPTGTQFVIKDIIKFQQVVLPKYFRHNKINSFIRQLNMYGFHKSRKQHSKSVFSHPLFLKDRQDLLSSIKRKIKQNQEAQIEADNVNVENINTPIKPIKVGKQEMQTVLTGRQLIQATERPAPSYLNFGQSLTFKHLFESKQAFPKSTFNFNFSVNKFSMNFNQSSLNKIGNFKEQKQQNQDDDKISIAGKLQKQEQRNKQLWGISMLSLPKFLNPSCFFNSFDTKK